MSRNNDSEKNMEFYVIPEYKSLKRDELIGILDLVTPEYSKTLKVIKEKHLELELVAKKGRELEDNIKKQSDEINKLKLNNESISEISSLRSFLKEMKELVKAIEEKHQKEKESLLYELNEKDKLIESIESDSVSKADELNKLKSDCNIKSKSSNNDTKELSKKLQSTLTTFHGRTGENIGDWLFYTNRVMEHSSHNDREKILLASSYLRDIAQQDYILYEQTHKNITWDEFTHYLKNKYTPKNNTTIIRKQLKELKHLNSVNDYFVSFRKLVNQLPNMSGEDRMIYFIEGLKFKTRKHVQSEKPKTLDEAFDLASDFETFNSFEVENNFSTIIHQTNQGRDNFQNTNHNYTQQFHFNNNFENNQNNYRDHNDGYDSDNNDHLNDNCYNDNNYGQDEEEKNIFRQQDSDDEEEYENNYLTMENFSRKYQY